MAQGDAAMHRVFVVRHRSRRWPKVALQHIGLLWCVCSLCAIWVAVRGAPIEAGVPLATSPGDFGVSPLACSLCVFASCAVVALLSFMPVALAYWPTVVRSQSARLW